MPPKPSQTESFLKMDSVYCKTKKIAHHKSGFSNAPIKSSMKKNPHQRSKMVLPFSDHKIIGYPAYMENNSI